MSNWHVEETYKGLIQLSQGALRFSVLANGGALVALLAFLGQAVSARLDASSIKVAFVLFICGVTVGGLAHVTAYLTQLALYNESTGQANKGVLLGHGVFLWSTIALVVVSVILFGAGAYQAVNGLVNLSPVGGRVPL